VISVDYTKWNADNTANGFPAMTSPEIGIGFGFSSKQERTMFDINFVTFGARDKIEKGAEAIRTNFTSFLQYQFGYDLIRSKAINLYPYAGLGIKTISIEYSAPAQLNPTPQGISGIVQTNRSVSDDITGLL
jgi:hypothetical protein